MTPSLSDTLQVTIAEQNYEIFMSFGLMNTLVIPIETVENLISMDSDPDVRNFILTQCLSKRDAQGKVLELFQTHSVSYSQGEEILSWVRGHLENFFLTRLRNKLKIQQEVNQTILQH